MDGRRVCGGGLRRFKLIPNFILKPPFLSLSLFLSLSPSELGLPLASFGSTILITMLISRAYIVTHTNTHTLAHAYTQLSGTVKVSLLIDNYFTDAVI